MRLLFLIACLIPLAAGAQGGPPELRRGVNLSSWLAGAPRQPLSERDFRQIRAAGFDHVRLPFDPTYFGYLLKAGAGNPGTISFAPLDHALGLAEHSGLAVVLDVHPGHAFMETLENEPWAEQQFIDLWIAIAQRYKSKPAGAIVFSLLNEPQYYHQEVRYADFARRLVKAVRGVDPKHLIIVGAPHGSSIEGLLALEPVADPHIAYDFHFYEPYIVTHQGINEGFDDKMIRYFRHVPYPSDRVRGNAGAYTEKAPNPLQAQSELDEYVNAKWNAEHIADRIRIARDWATATKTHILCGEFGVLRLAIDADSRYRWIHDVRQALEKQNIGWEVWDYTDGFGIAAIHGVTATDPDGTVKLIDADKGSRTLEPAAFGALGLKK